MMVVYEIHTIRDGAWKIDSIFDDRDLAVLEAHRVERTFRYAGVRVIEETYDEATDRTVTRTIYRSNRINQPKAADAAAMERLKQRAAAAAAGAAEVMVKPPPSLAQAILMATLKIGAIFFCGLGALYALNTLTR